MRFTFIIVLILCCIVLGQRKFETLLSNFVKEIVGINRNTYQFSCYDVVLKYLYLFSKIPFVEREIHLKKMKKEKNKITNLIDLVILNEKYLNQISCIRTPCSKSKIHLEKIESECKMIEQCLH